jgi:hypothetical protein
MTAAQPPSVQCTHCQKRFALAGNLERRPLASNRQVVDVGLACPHCRHFVHSYFDTPKIRRGRKSLKKAEKLFQRQRTADAWEKFQRAKTTFQELFNAEQRSLRMEV